MPRRNEGPVFEAAAILIPSISAAYGWGYAVEVIYSTEKELIVKAETYLIRFVEDEREMVRVYSNVEQTFAFEPPVYLDPESALWEDFFPQPRHFRDLLEAFAKVQGDRVYG